MKTVYICKGNVNFTDPPCKDCVPYIPITEYNDLVDKVLDGTEFVHIDEYIKAKKKWSNHE